MLAIAYLAGNTLKWIFWLVQLENGSFIKFCRQMPDWKSLDNDVEQKWGCQVVLDDFFGGHSDEYKLLSFYDN